MRKLLSLMLTLTLFSCTLQAAAKPHIVVLATGGTIAGAQSSKEQAGYTAGSFSVDNLIQAVPQLKDLADLSGEQVANIGSQNMNNEVWLQLAARAQAVLARDDVDGVVVTHGTDTMEETSWFLDLVIRSDKPIVFVGSMRPETAISADGPANLYNAVAVAAHPEAGKRGVLVLMNDDIHFAREITKHNTTHLNTFRSFNRGRAGTVNTGTVHWFNSPTTPQTANSAFSLDGVTELPRVEIVYSYANLGRERIDFLVEKGVKGIVLAGVGDGNTTDPALAALSNAVQKGVAVVRSSRTGSGLVVRNVEINDDQMGTIAAMEFNPQKARILLMLALLKTDDAQKIQQTFATY